MRALPAEERAKIEQLTEGLKLEKSKLERELTKWDESGNDIIILAKKMCMMMMEMSDFTRWSVFIMLSSTLEITTSKLFFLKKMSAYFDFVSG